MKLTLYSLATLAALLIDLGLGAFIFCKNPRGRLNCSFAWLMLIFVVWGSGEFAMRMTSSPDVALRAEMFSSIGYVFSPSFVLYFTLVLTKRDELFANRYLLHSIVFLPSIFFLILLQVSQLVIRGVTRTYWGFTAVLGPSFIGFAIYLVAFLSLAFCLLVQDYRTSKDGSRKKQTQFILIGMLIPCIAGPITDILYPIFGFHSLEVGFSSTAFTGILVGYAISRYKLMISSPVLTAKTVLSTMSGSLFVLNSESVITMINTSMSELSGYKREEIIGRSVKTVLGTDNKIVSEAIDSGGQLRDFYTHLLTKSGERIPLSLNVVILRNGGGRIQGVVCVAEDLRKMRTYLTAVTSLAETVDARDASTAGHSRRVKDYSLLFADMLGLRCDEIREIETAALLHDIGKVGISDEILLKPGTLDDDEWHQVKMHPIIGVRILKPLSFLRDVIPIIRHHHERFDGSGYPAGLRGSEIPRGARILAIADTFDAMASIRPYRAALTTAQMFRELVKGKGTQFDPELVVLFLQWLRGYEAKGSFGQSSSVHASLQGLSKAQVDFLVGNLFDGDEYEVRKRIVSILQAVSGDLFGEANKLTGSRISEVIEAKFNEFSNQNKRIFYINEGLTVIKGVDRINLHELIEEYKKHLRVLMKLISQVTGKRLCDSILSDALTKYDEAVALLFSEFIVGDRILP